MPDTYRGWLQERNRPNKGEDLGEYVRSLVAGEGWTSEYKASATDVDYGVREATAALHNARGGEVFVGVENDGRVTGTGVTEATLNERLRQGAAPRAPWHTTDLTLAVKQVVEVPECSPRPRAFVLEVNPPNLPAFALDKKGRLRLPLRSGSSTRLLDAAESISFVHQSWRGLVLRSCYRELETFARQISQHQPLADSLPDPLPYIQSIAESGVAYTVLTDQDRAAIFGEGAGSGRSAGAVDVYYKAVRRARAVLNQQPVTGRNLAVMALPALGVEFANLESERDRSLDDLKKYIQGQGYVII